MTSVINGSQLFTYTPAQWRMIHYLRGERVVSWPGRTDHGGRASTGFHDARRLVERQGAQLDDLQLLEHYGKIEATVGLGGPPIKLVDLQRLPKTGRPGAQIKVALTNAGQSLARDPMHLVLQSAGRKKRYLVSDVAHSAGIARGDVKPILFALESADLAGIANDIGYVPVAMWTRDIPGGLRVRLTRKGRTYLARK